MKLATDGASPAMPSSSGNLYDILHALPIAVSWARLPGPDEFGVLLHVPDDVGEIGAACDSIVAALQQPMARDGVEIHVGASIGGCLYPQQAADLNELIQRADQALYHVKTAGIGRWGMDATRIARQRTMKPRFKGHPRVMR